MQSHPLLLGSLGLQEKSTAKRSFGRQQQETAMFILMKSGLKLSDVCCWTAFLRITEKARSSITTILCLLADGEKRHTLPKMVVLPEVP
jgi:hypothetical protein